MVTARPWCCGQLGQGQLLDAARVGALVLTCMSSRGWRLSLGGKLIINPDPCKSTSAYLPGSWAFKLSTTSKMRLFAIVHWHCS